MAALSLLTYRPPTHAIMIDLPIPSGVTDPSPVLSPVRNLVSVSPTGQITWNGAKVTDVELLRNAELALSQTVQPILVFQPDGDAAYLDAVNALAILHLSGATSHSFCFGGISEHRRFDSPAYVMAFPILLSTPVPEPPLTGSDESMSWANFGPYLTQEECEGIAPPPPPPR